MKCPKCRKIVTEDMDYCPNCKMNLSFTTKTKSFYKEANQTFENISKKTNNLKAKIGIIAIFAVISLLAFVSFGNIFLIFKVLAFILKYSKMLILIGVMLLVFWLILFFNKKKLKIMKILFTCSLILIVAPTVLSGMIQIEGDISYFLKDYSKEKYIIIGDEKIPSLYSVVGYRKISANFEEKNHYDEDSDLTTDFISLIYENISEDDKSMYGNKLINNNFKLYIIDGEEGIVYAYCKEKNNKFYSVAIYAEQITYSTGVGSIKDILNSLDEE